MFSFTNITTKTSMVMTLLALTSRRRLVTTAFRTTTAIRTSSLLSTTTSLAKVHHDQCDQRHSLPPVMRLETSSRLGTTLLFSTSTNEEAAASATTTTASPTTVSSVTTTSSSSSPSSPRRVKTKDATTPTDYPIKIQGWVRTLRKQKTLAFVEVNDGSNLAGIQCVFTLEGGNDDANNNNKKAVKQALAQVTTGCAVEIHGPLVVSQGGKQAVEVQATFLQVLGACPADSYPLAKKRHSLDYLRTMAHLRPRTNTIAATARVRSALAGAIHSFFQSSGFVYVQTPLITASDCEGAGELFRVTTLNLDQLSKIPRLQQPSPSQQQKPPTTAAAAAATDDDQNNNNNIINSDQADYKADFFGKPAFLTVSGQLNAETFACAMGDVYTFGPTFRAENSQTARHLAEFNMVEPEMAFCDLFGAMDNVEQMLQYVVQYVLDHCRDDLEFFQKFYNPKLVERLIQLTAQPFVRIPYRDAIQHLQEEIQKDASKWQYPNVVFGTDLATEHERWLAETKFDSAVFVYNYPRSIKAFYMRNNDADDGETVHAMDLLVPGVGELVGGSQREERLEVLQAKMKDLDLDPADYWWYLDLRRYGSVPHAGYGLGFERLVTYVCGLDNIRDAIAFPRYPGNAEF